MEEKSREQKLSAQEITLIRELAQIRKEQKRDPGGSFFPALQFFPIRGILKSKITLGW